MSSKPVLKLDWATHKAAKYAVENWHYSRTMPASKSVKIGAWEDGSFIGALVFAWGANPYLGRSVGCEMTECAELVRVALREHATPVTRIMAIAIKMLKKQSPGLRVLISYADANKGHYGGIYQGGGWVYTGRTSSTYVYEVNGVEIHKRRTTGGNFGRSKGQLVSDRLPDGAVKVARIPKYKYVLGLNDADRLALMKLAKPYPKKKLCAGSADSGTPTVQVGRDGAEPIPALHLTGEADSAS